jgi:hypothetical protein
VTLSLRDLREPRIAQIIAPGAGRLHEPRLDPRKFVVVRHAIRAAHSAVHPRDHPLAQLRRLINARR